MQEQLQRGSSSQSSRTDGGRAKSNAIEVPSISLPKGGGAIKGIDEKFSVNAANGTASLGLPLPFSPARNGFMPALSLAYNSGAGNGVFGLGWDLGFPSIQRKTDKKLPRYHDDEDSDVFMFSGAEDLVPLLVEIAGVWAEPVIPAGNYTIRQYRPRIEGGFSRIERITHDGYGVWWKVTSRDNVVTFFGKSPAYRITDPADVSRIFQWLPELSFDDKGNCVLYEFKSENGHGYGNELQDANRFNADRSIRFANRYLKRIYYCPRLPFLPPLISPDEVYNTANPSGPRDFLMELVLDYGEHGSLPGPTDAHAEIDHAEMAEWHARHDAFSSYRSGFEIRTARLCRRVLMFHHFAELGHEPCLVRSLDLQYRDRSLQHEPEEGKKLEVTYLVSAARRSYIREEGGAAYYRHRSLPPMEFGYQELIWNKDIQTASAENMVHAPAGLSSGYQWVDLYGEGISGILTEQGEGWFYKENLGDGEFSNAQPVIPRPSLVGLGSGVLQLQDLEADGRKQVVVNSPELGGYFELAEDQSWESFRVFNRVANVDLRDANTRMLDLNGDGRPDIVITEENVFTWYPSAGVLGYDAPELAPKPFDEEQGPAIVFADSSQSIFLADMGGDGLTDIVRIRNGEVCYWPNLGYGNFGTKITMNDSPWFDLPEQFNPALLHLADVSGTGATDIVYLGKDCFVAWLNLSGNGWTATCAIDPFPATASPNTVTVTDLLGNGTACIVWSSPLPGNTHSPLRYIDLMGGQKPHILNAYKNNLGQTSWAYKSSTHFYLEDKKAGKPWVTKLPFPVQVLSKVTMTDKWRKTSFTNSYTYHHGYYDHPEREFRGFGRVEQVDVESFGEFAAGNEGSPYITQDKTLYQPPVKTVTWFHTGAFLNKERILDHFAHEYFQPAGGGFYENELPAPDLSVAGLSAVDYREALRACKGMTLRQEVYELDVDALERGDHIKVKLFSTAFHNSHIRRLQPRANNLHAVFLVTESESITYQYELDLQDPGALPDPRIAHTLNLTIDEYGQALQTVAIRYPRWRDAGADDTANLSAETVALIYSVQREMHVAYSENRFTNDFQEPGVYRLRVPCEVLTYELTGFEIASPAHYFRLTDFRNFRLSELYQSTMFGTAENAVGEIAYHLLPDGSKQKRLVEDVRMLYFNDALNGPLPYCRQGRLGLPYETYKLALSGDLLAAALGTKLAELQRPEEARDEMLDRVLGTEGGYHFEDDQWWIRSGIAGFAEDAARHFYLPERYTDPFNNVTVLEYDSNYDLFIHSSTDAIGNHVAIVRFDYRVLAPLQMQDINGNNSSVAFDILGMPCAAAAMGKVHPDGTNESGDRITGIMPDLALNDIIAFFTGNFEEAAARSFLSNATARHLYYFGERRAPDGHITYGHQPACAAALLREKHIADDPSARLQVGFAYSDGSGAILVTKAQAEPDVPGGPLRWIAKGKTISNNKGKPVKQYEPYFCTNAHLLEEAAEVGVTPLMYYDAVGRLIRTEAPDGSYSRVEFSPWFSASYDASDTVGPGTTWYDRNLSGTAVQQRAAANAIKHAGTPAVTHLDSLGREVIAVAHNRLPSADAVFVNTPLLDRPWVDERYITYSKLDAEGKPLWIRDARGNRVMEYINIPGADSGYAPCYDIAGNLLFQHSMDAGDRWMLTDATGKPMYAWDVNDRFSGSGPAIIENRIFHTRYDALHRPLEQQLKINDGDWVVTELMIYGEGRADSQAYNLRGQIYQHNDPSGCITNIHFDFNGNLLETSRQLIRDISASVIDWTGGSALGGLEDEVFTQRTQYDALKRMIRMENWHLAGRSPAVYVPEYNERGALQRESLSVRGAITEAICSIEYDAKGQRTLIQYGNRTTTSYSYDPLTFRLSHLRTTGAGSSVFQDLSYTYDPSGNIIEIRNDAFETIFYNNERIEPRSQYVYDALYRLIEATGRENIRADHAPGPEPATAPLVRTGFPPAGNALRNYRQRYAYDCVGNIMQMRHIAGSGSLAERWTRHYAYDARSNRLDRTWEGDDIAGAVQYLYDTHGSMRNFSNSIEALCPQWDYRDMIHALNLGGGGMAHYNYDSQKQRSRKRIVKPGGIVEERIYLSGMEWYRRFDSEGNIVEKIETQHLFADKQRVLIVEDVLQTNNAHLAEGVLFRYQFNNHLGSVSLELNANADVISYEEYHPYGTTAYTASNVAILAAAKRYRYTGMERDEESGLAYHTARYYLPWLGRWGSADPILVQGGLNLFSYVNNSPIGFVDLQGNVPAELRVLGGFIAGLASVAVEGASTTYHATRAVANAYMHPVDTARQVVSAVTRVASGTASLSQTFSQTYNRYGGGIDGVGFALDATITSPVIQAIESRVRTEAHAIEGELVRGDYYALGHRVGNVVGQFAVPAAAEGLAARVGARSVAVVEHEVTALARPPHPARVQNSHHHHSSITRNSHPATVDHNTAHIAENAEESFENLINVDEFSNNPVVADRLDRARELDIGSYHDLTGSGRYGRVGDNLDSDEALQNLFVREQRGVERHAAILRDNPAIALRPQNHRRIGNLRSPQIQGLSAEQVLQHHISQMQFVPEFIVRTLEKESLRYIKAMGL